MMLRTCLSGLAIASLLSGTAMARQQVAELKLNQTLSGALAEGDEALKSGEKIDHFTFQVREGETYQVSMTSGAFDTYLIVRGPGDLSQDNDDEAQGALNSRVRFTAAASGEVKVGATSAEAAKTGAYEITVVSGDAAMTGPAPVDNANRPSLLVSGQPVDGVLEASDRPLPSGEFVDGYAFMATAGRTYEVTMTSSAVDSYLMVRNSDGLSLDNDDEAQGVLNAKVTFTAQANAQITVAATSAEPAKTGAYQVTMTER